MWEQDEDEKIDRELDTEIRRIAETFKDRCIQREEPQGFGPWKWQLIRQLERIATALERRQFNENERTFNETNENECSLRITKPEPTDAKREACRRAGQASARIRRSRRNDASPSGPGSVGNEILTVPDHTPATKMNVRSTKRTYVQSAGRQIGKVSTAALVKSYCDAFKARYGLNPPIDGKTAGLASNLLKTMPLERAQALVQAYLQMEDKWFLIKCHDFPTFTQSITKVAVSLFHGTVDPHEKNYWAKVFGGSTDGHESIPAADNALEGELGRAQLQSGADRPILEELPVGDE